MTTAPTTIRIQPNGDQRANAWHAVAQITDGGTDNNPKPYHVLRFDPDSNVAIPAGNVSSVFTAFDIAAGWTAAGIVTVIVDTSGTWSFRNDY